MFPQFDPAIVFAKPAPVGGAVVTRGKYCPTTPTPVINLAMDLFKGDVVQLTIWALDIHAVDGEICETGMMALFVKALMRVVLTEVRRTTQLSLRCCSAPTFCTKPITVSRADIMAHVFASASAAIKMFPAAARTSFWLSASRVGSKIARHCALSERVTSTAGNTRTGEPNSAAAAITYLERQTS
jgi:hypothetical protein